MVMSSEWTQRDYQKIVIHWKPEGRKKKEAVPGEPGEMEYIQT